MSSINVIEVKDLCREYIVKKGFIKREKRIVSAVNHLNFYVEQGEIFGLLGPNGAGKTTTIKMLTTLLAPTSGLCQVFGCNVFGEEKKIRPRINFIFGGETGVYRRLSGMDNLVYFSNLYNISKEKQKKILPELLSLVHLEEGIERKVETYSKGMVQRLQIARGLINDPDIIFMDEPTIGLDPVGASELRQLIRLLKKRGKTVLLTTHYMQEAEELCDHIAIIHHGRLLANDTVENLKQQMKHIDLKEPSLEEVYIRLVNDEKLS